jgi:hypothetical protein
MTQENALKFIEINNIQLDKYKSVIVTSDNAVYMDSELAPIKAHCEAHNKTYFVVKSNEVEAEKVEAKTEEAEAKPKKKKQS